MMRMAEIMPRATNTAEEGAESSGNAETPRLLWPDWATVLKTDDGVRGGCAGGEDGGGLSGDGELGGSGASGGKRGCGGEDGGHGFIGGAGGGGGC